MPSPIFNRPGPAQADTTGEHGPRSRFPWETADHRDRLRRLLAMLPVAGQSDIARALNLSRQRIGQYRKLSDFPKPVQTVNGAPVWILGDVLEWHEARVTKREAKR